MVSDFVEPITYYWRVRTAAFPMRVQAEHDPRCSGGSRTFDPRGRGRRGLRRPRLFRNRGDFPDGDDGVVRPGPGLRAGAVEDDRRLAFRLASAEQEDEADEPSRDEQPHGAEDDQRIVRIPRREGSDRLPDVLADLDAFTEDGSAFDDQTIIALKVL